MRRVRKSKRRNARVVVPGNGKNAGLANTTSLSLPSGKFDVDRRVYPPAVAHRFLDWFSFATMGELAAKARLFRLLVIIVGQWRLRIVGGVAGSAGDDHR